MRDPARFLLAHTPSPHPAPTLTFWCFRGDRQMEEGLVRVHWRRRDPVHHFLGDQALRAPPVPQLRSQKLLAGGAPQPHRSALALRPPLCLP